jgi:signal transduction histidine kinase/ligand-binding sensor domain-containing protein/DNA-binding response OmpR family regulator
LGKYRTMVKLITILVALMVFQKMAAQPDELLSKRLVFDQLKEQRLAQSTINCVLQDRDGFLWIGTWSGLVRYDGYTTRVFHSEKEPGKIKSNKITAIYEDREGFLWIGTHMGGLFRYDKYRNNFKSYMHDPNDSQSLSNNNVWSIQEDHRGNLWIGTEKGLNILQKENGIFERIITTNTPSLSHDFITHIFLSSDGNLWVGTEYALNKLQVTLEQGRERYSFQVYEFPDDPENSALHNYIYQIGELKSSEAPAIWYSTMKGIKELNGNVLKNYTLPNKPSSSNFFRSMLPVNAKNPYIILGSEMGISIFDAVAKQFESGHNLEYEQLNLSHNSVTSLYIDKGGVLWAGTKKGLCKFDTYTKNFEWYNTAQFDKTKSIITAIQMSSLGGYWVSTIGGGLFRFDGQDSFTRYKIKSTEENDFSDFIQTLYADGKGDVWVGTAGAGVYHFREEDLSGKTIIEKYDQYSLKSQPALDDDYVMSLAKDREGNMYAGLWSGGLNKITTDKKVIPYRNPLLRQAPLVALHPDHAGVLWAGTRGNGVYRIKEVADSLDIRHYTHESARVNALSNNFVNCIFEDHAGLLWIGTDEGLNSFDRRTELFACHVPENNLDIDVVVSILEDNLGRLWLAHWTGLTVIDPAHPGWVRNYDQNDRIMGGFFYNNVCLKSREGHLLFAGSEGFNRIDPQRIVQKPQNSKLAITQFELLGKPVGLDELVNNRVLINEPLRHQSRIDLKHHERSFAFEFASLDFAAPEKIRYAYKLEGFDEQWNFMTSERRFANYTNLNHGQYVFKVKASSSDGVWSNSITEVYITILAPWWKTDWAVLLYIAFAVLVLYGFRKLILMRANLLHDIKLERVQREHVEKLNKAKLRFFTNISHEFRTPLTLILGPAQNLMDSHELSTKLRNHIVAISNNAQRLLRLVTQLMDFRKAESGNLDLRVSEGNFVKFVKEVKLSFDLLAEQAKISFLFETSTNVIKLWFDRDQFEKILFNLLSNAFKHTPEGGTITVRLHELEKEVLLVVEDTGKGINPSHFEGIFQTFFSFDEDRQHMGTGIGLALTKSLVDMHHGSIQVESKEGIFTRFTVTLLKGSSHFKKEEISHFSDDVESLEQYPSLLDTRTILERIEKGEDKPVEISGSSRPKILVIEDNEDVRTYIKSIFNDRYEVLEAADGQQGWHMAEVKMPELIISDVMMPIMDGITLCRKLKSDVKTSHIPVILLTARTSLIFKVEGLETGADDYVTKPFNPKVLELKVRNLVRTREQMRQLFANVKMLAIEPKKITLTSPDERFLQHALESIENHMSDPEYSVETLGKDVGMSRMQLYRKLKALTDHSANEFIRSIRLKRAAQLLEQNQLSVAEVTYDVGFTDLPYFRECFKKMFGVTPSEYAQAAQQKEGKDV